MNSRSIDSPDELVPTRRSLLERLRDLDDRAELARMLRPRVEIPLLGRGEAGLSDEDARDVVQEMVIAVAKGRSELRTCPLRP